MDNILKYIEDFLLYKESLGFSRRSYEGFLNDFARSTKNTNDFFFAKSQVDSWCAIRSSEIESGFRRRITALREFSKYLYALKKIDFIISTDNLPRCNTYTPYIFSDLELYKLFEQADLTEHNSRCSENHLIIPTIYRLIYFCGLRPNEGRELLRQDVDVENGTLFIRKNKTRKERLIPMSDDVTEMCRKYLLKINLIFPNSKYFFPASLEQSHSAKWLTKHFLKLWQQCKTPDNSSRVRVYDLRHRYATAVFMKWLDDEEDLYALLPYLSSYMGHAHFEETAYYIHLLPEKLKRTNVFDWNSFGKYLPEVDHE